ncbi:hypothetical protein HYV12_04020 [Candidatus Dojkabacteria bacterium]|nr:hypothetical protein [Candidatus Dojkabacteria bacterium]
MSINKVIEKVKDVFKDKKWGGVLMLAVIVLIVVVIISIVNSFKKEEKPTDTNYLIETPMQYDGGHSVYIPQTVSGSKSFPNSLPVFQIEEVNHSGELDKFLLKIGKTGFQKDTIGTSLYSWMKGNETLEYIPFQQQLTFKFTDSFKTNITTQFSDSEDVNKFFEKFMLEYFGVTNKYINGKAIVEGKRIRLEVNRNVNNFPLYLQNHNSYTDYLVVDSNGGIYEGGFTLVEYTEEGESIQLVHPTNLQRLIASADYPKDIFEGFSEDLKEILNAPGASTLDATDQISELPHPTISEAKDISLGYYYSSDSYKQIIPIYRIEAIGTITYLGKNAKIPLLIYANALDPDRVYIPTE